MTTLHALLIGGGLLVIALVVMAARSVASPGRLLAVVLLALVTSSASAFYSTTRSFGAGEHVSRGYPRPYHFQWSDLDGLFGSRRVNIASYATNTLVHLGVIALAMAVLARRRATTTTGTMGGGMVVVRVSLGVFFLVLAVIGGMLPVMQGWVFFLLAMLVLFPKAKFTEKVLQKAAPKVPRLVALLRRLGIGSEVPPRDTMRTE
ncbi:MAG TPA: hypothetical protein VNA04_06635 [Thermoanaerobaculia bacterium]|nr:hypothetical protein [Thermoanaerobaculia bacterium]